MNSAAGYGVHVGEGAWADIRRNVFDHNRHAITANANAGGYDAYENFVLKGGGIHGTEFNYYTHSFDVHGTGCLWDEDLCGDAGHTFEFIRNAFQYRSDNAISIRGRPLYDAYIGANVFPHEGLENDAGDDAIKLQTSENVRIGSGNLIEVDSYGRYGVCDFDGDGLDDLFLPTRVSWWYSSQGKFHWTFLNVDLSRKSLSELRLGYFNDDLRCDVLAEFENQWFISSGGTGPWQSIGSFGVALQNVVFGRFDQATVPSSPVSLRRTTHAFYREPAAAGRWFITPLTSRSWRLVGSSTIPLNWLRFGDFTGDGVTDVLAVSAGRWAISESARGQWRTLNAALSNDVTTLLITDVNRNNIDDLIRAEQRTLQFPLRRVLTWWISDDGRSPWRRLADVQIPLAPPQNSPSIFTFAGYFGTSEGGALMFTDYSRYGRVYTPTESWSSYFPYLIRCLDGAVILPSSRRLLKHWEFAMHG